MGLFNVFQRKTNVEETRSTTFGGVAVANWDSSFGYGKEIDKLSVVYGCINLRASSIASLPIQLNRKLDKGHEAATDHPYYRLITKTPNPFQTNYNFWHWAISQLDLFGNVYIQKLRKNDGTVSELIPLNPSWVQIDLNDAGLPVYKMALASNDGTSYQKEFTNDQIIHIKGYSRNGIYGLSIIDTFRTLFDGYSELENTGTQIAKQAAKPNGIVTHPSNMKEEEINKLKSGWQHGFSGNNSGKTAFVPAGITVSAFPSTLNAEQIQYISSKNFSAQRIVADLFGCPLHKFGLNNSPTYGSVEQSAIEYVQYTLSPIISNIEQQIQKQLLDDSDEVYINFDVKGLLRGDVNARISWYKFMLEHGCITPNQVNEMEDTGIVVPADKGGDEYQKPLNFGAASAAK